MAINSDKPHLWKADVEKSIDWIWEHRTPDFAPIFAPKDKKKAPALKEATAIYGVDRNQEQENNRAEAQLVADATKSAEERNRLGQFSTPFPVASRMVAHALKALPSDAPVAFLEPALGSGVFYSALLRQATASQITSATGCEIDPCYSDIAKTIWSPSGLRVLNCDFTAFATESSNYGRFSLICTNPPYVRHHHLQAEQKVALQSLVMQRLGLHVSGLSGLYVYFVLLADAVLADGAVASWLLPAEFLYVNYGRVLRDYLTSRVTLLSIHHFNPDDVQFDDALVSSCIVTYRKNRSPGTSSCAISYGDYLDPQEQRTMPTLELRGLNKWTMSHFENNGMSSDAPRLKDFFSVRRGIATGANAFFILDTDTIAQYDIPSVFLKPILPSPRYLREPVIRATVEGLPHVPGFRYLLDCRLPPNEVQRQYPSLWRYLEEGMAKGIADGYLCSQKEVWHYQERRKPAPFLASYMGRSNGNRECPIRFFVNFSDAMVTNVFLNLYPTPELAACLDNDKERLIELGEALNNVPAECILHAGRAYGGGLHKIEPKELLEVRLVSAPAWVDEALTKQLVLI